MVLLMEGTVLREHTANYRSFTLLTRIPLAFAPLGINVIIITITIINTRPGSAVDLYDSTVDSVQDPKIFVTYHDPQAYPEYLIKFVKHAQR